MGEGIVMPVQKTSVTRRLEAISRDPERLNALLNALKDPQQDFIQLCIDHALANEVAAGMMRRYWFPADWQDAASRCWWREHQPIEPIIRQGMIRACEEAQQRRLPIDAYWVIGHEVAVSISWNTEQITLLRITPPIPADYILPEDDPRLTHQDPIVVVRREIVIKQARSVPDVPGAQGG